MHTPAASAAMKPSGHVAAAGQRGRGFGVMDGAAMLCSSQAINVPHLVARPAGTALAGQEDFRFLRRTSMGKYFIGWLLGVPAIVLVILYFFFH